MAFLETDVADFTKYFLEEDSFGNLNHQVSLTLNKRYKCIADCDVCYLKDKWISDKEFPTIASYTENHLNPEWEENFFDFASNFHVLSTIDDMRYLKRNFKYQYDFYKKYSEEFTLSSLTNQAMFYHMPIMMNEMKFKDIYEITFSDVFLYHNQKKIITMMKRILKRYPIKHIKIIMAYDKPEEKQLKMLKEFQRFLEGEGIGMLRHHNVLEDYAKVQDAAHAMYSEGDGPVPILNQMFYVAFDDIYMELEHFTLMDNKFKVASLNQDLGLSDLLYQTLETKLNIYESNSCKLKNKESHFVKYFQHCADTFTLNKDYNFIPRPMIKGYSIWKDKLVGTGDWIETPLGLLKAGETDVKSIIEART